MSSGKQKPLDQVSSELQEFGFRINEKFLVSIFGEDSSCSFDEAYSELIDADFRKNSGLNPSFGATINTAENDVLEGPVVLQVTSVTNIAQPSKRQHEDSTPRLLLIKLNDGHTSASALEFERISDLSTKVAPGTKILIKHSVRICCGKILLSGNSCRVLGGRVDHLFKAWLTNRSTVSSRKQKKQESGAEGESPPEFEFTIDATVSAKSDKNAPEVPNKDSKASTMKTMDRNFKPDKRPATQAGAVGGSKKDKKGGGNNQRGGKEKHGVVNSNQSSHHSKSKHTPGFKQQESVSGEKEKVQHVVSSQLPPPPKRQQKNDNNNKKKGQARGSPNVGYEKVVTGNSQQLQKSKASSDYPQREATSGVKESKHIDSVQPPPPPPQKKHPPNPKSQAKGKNNANPSGREKGKGLSKQTGGEKAEPPFVDANHTRVALHKMQLSGKDISSKHGQTTLTSSAPSFVPSSQPPAVMPVGSPGTGNGISSNNKNNKREVKKKSYNNAKVSKKYTFT